MVALGRCGGSAVSLGLICTLLRVLISCPQSRWALSWGCGLAWSPRPGEAPCLSPPAPSTSSASDTPYASQRASSLCSGKVLLGIKWALDWQSLNAAKESNTNELKAKHGCQLHPGLLALESSSSWACSLLWGFHCPAGWEQQHPPLSCVQGFLILETLQASVSSGAVSAAEGSADLSQPL